MYKMSNGRKVTKKELYSTKNLNSVAALLEIGENEMGRMYEEFVRECRDSKKRFSHEKFIDSIMDAE